MNSFNIDPILFSCIIGFVVLFTTIFGLVGNGIVIRVLHFQNEKIPFKTYILNLAVADLGVLMLHIVFQILCIVDSHTPYDLNFPAFSKVFHGLIQFMYMTVQLLLTTISLDLCGFVLFPILKGVNQSSHSNTKACAIIWVLSSFLTGIQAILNVTDDPVIFFLRPSCIVNTITLKIMTISTLTTLKISLKSQLVKLFKVILLTLFHTLFFGYLLNFIFYIDILWHSNFMQMLYFLAATYNCSARPLLYYMVGKQKMGCSWESIKIALQRVFQEAEPTNENMYNKNHGIYANCFVALEPTSP